MCIKTSNYKVWLKAVLPETISKLLRAMLNYSQRLGHWLIIFVQVKGENPSDILKLFLSAMAAPILSLKELMSWQDPILLFDINVRVPDVGRFELRKHTDDLWHVLPWRERAIFRELHKRLRPNSVFVDAGANIGVYTVLASRLVGDNGSVIAIEMIPGTAEILRRHISLNNCHNVVVVENALSDRSGETVIATIQNGKCGQASIASSKQDRDGDRISIQTTTLDEICAGYSIIDLIKMDLEGVEALALSGANNTITKTKAVILETAHDGSDKASAIVKKAGFELHNLTGKDQVALRP